MAAWPRPSAIAPILIRESLAFGPEQVLDRHPAVLQRERRRNRAFQAHLGLVLAGDKAGHALLYQKTGDAVRARLRICLGRAGNHVGNRARGDPHLAAVQDVMVAVADGNGAGGAGIRAGLGFGQPEGGQALPRTQTWQPLPLLLLVAKVVDRRAAQRHVGRVDDRR